VCSGSRPFPLLPIVGVRGEVLVAGLALIRPSGAGIGMRLLHAVLDYARAKEYSTVALQPSKD